ncbi:MAG: hypothetical protein D6772_13110 [Bacteroidetes bacterium]|nr:MAG: hypothetical protein D6772_13110 [Bacteroidota bacterium]
MKQLFKRYGILLICLSLIGVAGLLNGTMDTLQFHYGKSIFPKQVHEQLLGQPRQFWDPTISWKNKYKDWPHDPRPRFPGATTWAVMFTDAWHLLKALMHGCFHLAILIPLVYYYKFPRWIILAAVVPLNLFFGAAFTLMYGHILLDKDIPAAE